MLLCFGVDTNIVIVISIVIVLGLNRPFLEMYRRMRFHFAFKNITTGILKITSEEIITELHF